MQKTKGLSQKEAQKKLKEYGYNEIKEINKISPFSIFLRQVKKNFIVYLLFASVLLSFFVNKPITGYAILIVIIIVIGSGFIQEYKAEKAIKALKQMIMPMTIVVRDGKEIEIPAREIVPEDIVILRTGEKIPADCLILEENELRADEAILTGESSAIKKEVLTNNVPEDKNMVFMGTCIISGKCIARVISTGMATNFGKIAKMISVTQKELPLQIKINKIAKHMTIISLLISFIIGAIMLTRSDVLTYEVFVEILIVVIALSVSAFPEGFPVILTSMLAIGAHKMAKKNAIVNRMSIIETLGETTLICADKTGTLTKGEMTVKQIFCSNKIYDITGVGYKIKGDLLLANKLIKNKNDLCLKYFFKTAALCNDAIIERKEIDMEFSANGSPTEVSLLIMAAKMGIYKDDLDEKRKNEIPFSSEKKIMTVYCEKENNGIIYSKGAPEIILEKCAFIQKENKIIKLSNSDKNAILKFNNQATNKAARVIALAYKKSTLIQKNNFEQNLVFLGLAAIEDPPREEIKHSIASCTRAGIKVKMITGDSEKTAVQIGNEIGLIGKTLNGEEIDRLSDDELIKKIKSVVIFARVRPDHKLRLVSIFKKIGEIVTMTGDGVNDAPALKEAHVGVAMGKGGTDVTREVGDLILKDNNFSTIVTAIKEGRTIFNNIQKFVAYQLSCNYAELFIIFLGILFKLPLPLLALQILFINLVTDNLPAISLATNRSTDDIMTIKPRKKSDILNKKSMSFLLLAGTIMTVLTFAVYFFSLKILNTDLATARTIALTTLIFMEIANAFNFRSFRKGVLTRSFFVNKSLVYTSIISLIATLAIIYTPLNKIFETAPLNWSYLSLSLITPLIIIIIFDILKIVRPYQH
ncbi:cation-transporting P-type ATPase [Patescibacteria group bacterium]|nr:cation-transporting P-type ATPase [Patescibacteria group bacterium]